jgi:hypothetical protein
MGDNTGKYAENIGEFARQWLIANNIVTDTDELYESYCEQQCGDE